LAAFLLPDRTDWVYAAAPEVAAEGWSGLLKAKLVHSMTSRTQLAAVGMRCVEPWEQSVNLLAALLDGLGAQALPVLTAKTRGTFSAKDRRQRLQAIAMLPNDEAGAYLVERLADEFAYEAATAAAGRFPVRMLRAVAAYAPQAPPARRPMLAGLVSTIDSRALDALAESERSALDQLAALVRPAPVASEPDLPELLVRPPWTVDRPERKAIVIRGLAPKSAVRVVWVDGERERYLKSAAEFDPGLSPVRRIRYYLAEQRP
jgi:hypothetical protein